MFDLEIEPTVTVISHGHNRVARNHAGLTNLRTTRIIGALRTISQPVAERVITLVSG